MMENLFVMLQTSGKQWTIFCARLLFSYFIKKLQTLEKYPSIFWAQTKYLYEIFFFNISSPSLGISTEIPNFLFNSFKDNQHPNDFLFSPQELPFINHI